MAKKAAKKEIKKEKKEVKEESKSCTCRTEQGFRINPSCGQGYGCLA
jgi:adenine C2-methylase RlmN of 23S rRNA A2503 and tRNA A37